MNKWENNDQGLFIPNRQLSFIVALLLLLAFSLFMIGYFLGKKKAVEPFVHNIQQEAFADQVYTTMLSSAHIQKPIKNNDIELINHDINEQNVVVAPVAQIISDNMLQDIQEQHYYAQLIGFGTEKAAQLFVKKLATKGIETEVKKRISKTAKGQTSYWYQVITAPYANKNDLSAIVDKLIKEENIKGVCICNC
jgi:cell division protein FtsN